MALRRRHRRRETCVFPRGVAGMSERELREAVLPPDAKDPFLCHEETLFNNEFEVECRGHAEARGRLDRILKARVTA